MHNGPGSMLAENTVFAGRYRIVRRIAAGGMGAVYEARHLETERPSALKVMLPHVAESAALRERFRLEARAAALVESAHVVEVLDAGVDEATESPFLVMELLRGEDLGRRKARLGRLSPEEVATWITQTARGLDALHAASIVHRDLKPSNLFVAERAGEAPRIKLLDLGVVKRVAETAGTTAAVGTPFYMAPEQLRNSKVGPATDVYALGMVAFSLLVGREYWADEALASESTLSFALTTLDGPKVPASERAAKSGVTLPAAFDTWFAQATAKDVEARFPSAGAAAEALARALDVKAESAMQAAPEAPARVASPDAETVPEVAPAQERTQTLSLGGEEKIVLPPPKSVTAPEAAAVSQAPADEPKAKGRSLGRKIAAALGIVALAAGGVLLLREKTLAPMPTPAPAPIAVVEAVECAAATITGTGATAALGDALGKGACARLAIELGVVWKNEPAARLDVNAEIAEGSTKVTLAIAGKKAEGKGETPIAATNAAIQALLPALTRPAPSKEHLVWWGASDAESARRIERVVRRRAFGFAAWDGVETEALVRSQPTSAVAHALFACDLRSKGDPARTQAAKEAALGRLGGLSQSRANLLEGVLRTYVPPSPQPEVERGVSLLIQSYGELAEAPDFAALYTSCGCIVTDQTLPMADWLAKRWPTMALPILRCALPAADDDDPRFSRFLGWMGAALPEMRGRWTKRLLEAGRIEEAREAVEIRGALGVETATRAEIARDRAYVAFASLDGRAAIAIAEELLGEPDPEANHEGATLRIGAMLLSGRVDDAFAAWKLEIGRQKILGREQQAEALAKDELRIRRLLGREKGDARAAEGEFEAALALEKRGSKKEAEEAYRGCLVQPWDVPFDAMAARVRLAEMLRAAGKTDEARSLDAAVDKAWAGADPRLRDFVRRMK
ncbi:serine/threonine-protein kinase [Polyangium jinanense]|uniref:Serine/threonine protein kinase n=1 Tax=Polyangium jinanense TaxID=2829994 RepID=A0A9X3X3E7_9BACT|nr:serine/threonine-protein kinase [Polyangium jinanense]MDC3980626.1 serine/threonine protein kinase [Polyangium jinanense]